MAYPPRITSREKTFLITTRTANHALWFINNADLDLAILANLTKVKTRYQARIYAYAIAGSHTHTVAQLPHGHVSDFLRDTNSGVAKAVPRL